jgi:tetratricopeptide (TPR) repeat protein
LTRAILLEPNDALTYNNRGYLYQKQKDFAKAIADYSKAIEINSKYISAYVNRAISKNETGDIEGAKNDFQISCDLDPKSAELKKYLGYAKLTLKDLDGACADFKEALKLGDTDVEQWIKEINCP